MFSRKPRIAFLLALSALSAAPTLTEPQQPRPTRPRLRRPRKRTPAAPAVRYTVARSPEDLASSLAGLTARTRSGDWGVMVTSLSRGDTLYAQNAGEQMLPASTMKLLTSAIALERFGPNYQFSTDALRDGPVGADGTLAGNIYLRGDGDPALSGKFLPGGPSAPMNRLADLVASKGIKHITGSVIGDATGFEDPPSVATGAFRNALIARGIKVDGDIRLGRTPASGVKVASLLSPPLASMIAAMNRESINIYAELLFRNAARGLQRDVVGSVASASALLNNFFATKVGADTSRLVFADGSGLSTIDRVTPRAQVQLLGYAHRSSWGPWLHSSLPVAGDSELLKRRMRNTPAEGNLHAKTGTPNEVIGLAGYVTAVNGEVLAFSFLYNGRDRWTAKSMIDVMSETLASFGR